MRAPNYTLQTRNYATNAARAEQMPAKVQALSEVAATLATNAQPDLIREAKDAIDTLYGDISELYDYPPVQRDARVILQQLKRCPAFTNVRYWPSCQAFTLDILPSVLHVSDDIRSRTPLAKLAIKPDNQVAVSIRSAVPTPLCNYIDRNFITRKYLRSSRRVYSCNPHGGGGTSYCAGAFGPQMNTAKRELDIPTLALLWYEWLQGANPQDDYGRRYVRFMWGDHTIRYFDPENRGYEDMRYPYERNPLFWSTPLMRWGRTTRVCRKPDYVRFYISPSEFLVVKESTLTRSNADVTDEQLLAPLPDVLPKLQCLKDVVRTPENSLYPNVTLPERKKLSKID